jgi:carbamoyl-phosphate synthase/aspartate carbamoyltransferase
MAELHPPVTAQILNGQDEGLISLELEDGTVYQGYSFGAKKSVAGELVFQTGMVGYPESITDPSYRGQILVITFPLVGNYGVPSRETMDDLLKDLPAHFEASQIHIAGLITASYSGEDFSHFLATSSLGTWLKEQGVPAIYGVDTRALTKRIREEGSMLGRMLLQKSLSNGQANGLPNGNSAITSSSNWRQAFEEIPWVNPNEMNLVADGKFLFDLIKHSLLMSWHSINSRTQALLAQSLQCPPASVRSTCACVMFRCRFEV